MCLLFDAILIFCIIFTVTLPSSSSFFSFVLFYFGGDKFRDHAKKKEDESRTDFFDFLENLFFLLFLICLSACSDLLMQAC